MKKSHCITPRRYALARFVHRNREHAGWVITAFVCFLLWFVNHENQRLSAEIAEARVAMNEKDRRIVALRQLNEETLARLQGLESGQRQILKRLDEGKPHASK